jgi:hypothetical protein
MGHVSLNYSPLNYKTVSLSQTAMEAANFNPSQL